MLDALPPSVRAILDAYVNLRVHEALSTDEHPLKPEYKADMEDRVADAIEAFQAKSRVFDGVAGGDSECFCWQVNRETYERLTGESTEDAWWNKEDKFFVYPHVVVGLGTIKDKTKKFTVIVEEV